MASTSGARRRRRSGGSGVASVFTSVAPSPASVESGDTLQFTAYDQNLSPLVASWTVTAPITVTLNADISDRFVQSVNATYLSARSGTGATLDAYTAGHGVANGFFSPNYTCQQALLRVDGSSIPDNATLLSITAKFFGEGMVFPVAGQGIQVRLRDWGTTAEAGDFVPGADLAALPLLASKTIAVAGDWLAAYNTLLSEVAFLTNFSKTGFTNMVVHWSSQTSVTAPTGDASVGFKSADSASPPQFVVTYLPA